MTAAIESPHITLVRQALLNTLSDLRSRDNPMDVDRARAVAQVASVLVDTAKVEIDYIKAAGGSGVSDFIEPPSIAGPNAHNPFPGATRHKLEG